MKWPGSTIWIALNRWHGDHRPLDDGFRGNAVRTLRIGKGLRVRLCMPRWLSRAWGPDSVRWNATYWWLRGWRSWWSPCRISVLRRARGHPTLRRRNGQGLEGLRWILRRWGSLTLLMRQWRVRMTSSDVCHVQNGAKSRGRLFEWLAAGRRMKKKSIRKMVQGFHNGKWGVWNEKRLWRSLNRFV